ncbi:MAG: glycosyltransferase family 9 protein [Bdellovibrionales bacterium]|nr:glycosyltransferase family 9 protein [Bdellovibrionales bacterium]
MKILIVQLARLGDIALTWPTIRALKRNRPSAEVHLLVRKSFGEFARVIPEVSVTHELDTAKWLLDLSKGDVKDVTGHFLTEIESIRNEKFDQVINLTFSISSSYLTHLLEENVPHVSGYSRFSDGGLKLSDHTSSYFFAQVGSHNRFHVGDLFSAVAGVELKFEDWIPLMSETELKGVPPYLVIHIGASEFEKTYPIDYWKQVINQLLKHYKGVVYLVGGKTEKFLSDEIEKSVFSSRLVSLVGDTSIYDLTQLISNSEVFIGCDSGPLHVATLSGVPAINLSIGPVRFWETGPRSAGSRVLISKRREELAPSVVMSEIEAVFQGRSGQKASIEVESPLAPYKTSLPSSFQWKLIEFLYIGEPAPRVSDEGTKIALMEIADLYEIVMKQLDVLRDLPNQRVSAGIISRCEEAIKIVGQKCEFIEPLVSWFFSELSRIGPCDASAAIEETRQKYFMLGKSLIELLHTTEKVGERNV